jgi:CRP-like cAMP-binding protein
MHDPGGLTVLTLVHARRFARLDMTMPAPGEEVGLLRRLAMFAPLPLAAIELLATDLKPQEFAPGTAAVCEGDAGDLFYLIVAGSATVNIGEKPGPSLSVGDCFGEIALLRDVPRVATVMADQPLRTLALERNAFLVAIASNSISSAAADALVDQRLIENTPADPDGGSAE